MVLQNWNDSYYSIGLNARGHKFYGLDVEPSVAAAAIFIESGFSATAYEIQYASCSMSGSVSASSDTERVQKAHISISGLSVTLVLAMEQVLARISIDIESSFISNTYKFAYSHADFSGDVSLAIDPMEIVFATSVISIAADVVPTAIEILYASVDAMTSESNFTADSTRVRVVSASLSAEVDMTVGSYKFAKAIIDQLGDVSLSATTYKDTYASALLSGDVNVTPTAREIQYASLSVSVEGTISPTAIEILYASSQTSSELSVNATAYEILFAVADLNIEGYTLTIAKEILYPDISISIDSDMQVEAYKFAYSESEINISSALMASAMEILYAEQSIAAQSNSQISGTKISLASANLSIEGYKVVVGKEIQYAKCLISITSDVIFVTPVRFSNNIIEDTQSIRTLLILDDKPLSEHNRTLSTSIIQPFVENINWKTRRGRYYKNSAGRASFSISWSFLPNDRQNTVDLKFGRDMINSIATDPDIHTLRFLNIDSDGTDPYTEEQYNVIVKNYSEKLVRRDVNNDVYFWDCQLELEEV